MPPLRSTGPFPEAEHPEFAGQYRLEACLGNGGMGVVHLATSASGLQLAVKVIHAEHALDPEFRARFRQEVAAARRVSGAFTAPVVDADPDAGRPWMATLFIEGPTLAERVKRNGPLDPDELRRAGAGLAEALRDIHRAGVVHRDLKPSNVLLAKDGPKVIDFGISRPVDSDLRTETGKLIGTPPFMAPEQFQRPREVGPEADVFALGAVLVHAATGRGPFDSDSPYIVAYQVVHNEPDLSGVPEDLVPLLARCLAKDPQARPTPYELMVALRASSPSSAYDTQAYIPAQREPGSTGKSEPEPEYASDRRPEHSSRPDAAATGAPPRRHGRRSRWALAAAAFTVLVSGGAVAINAAADDGTPVTPRSEPDFRPWSVALEDGAADATPVCSAGGEDALYCAAPGMKAARLDPADGSPVWSADAEAAAGGAGQSDEGLAPQLAGGLLHVVTPGAGHYEALDPRTGEPRWDLDVPAYATALTVGDTVLLVTGDGLIRAVDAATGEERWRKRHGGPGAHWISHPGGDGPAIAAAPSPDGTSTLISAVDPRSGELLWNTRLDGSLTPVQLSDGSLYLLSAGTDGFTRAVVTLDTATDSRPVRRVPLSVPADQAQATVAGQVVYIAGAGGSLTAVDTSRPGGRAQDAELWRLETGVAHLSRPVAGAGAVYLSAADGRLLAVDAKLGRIVGQTELRMADDGSTYASLLPAPVVVGGKIYATAPDGSVFAVDAKDPARW